jgi:hypothetical protein
MTRKDYVRCLSEKTGIKENSCKYKNYGKRDITVCDEWKNDFQAFYKWVVDNGYRLDLNADRRKYNNNKILIKFMEEHKNDFCRL